MKLVNVGYGNVVNCDKIVAIVGVDSAPIKRMMQAAKEARKVIDATQGRKTQCVVIIENGQLVLSALLPDSIAGRCRNNEVGENE